MEMCIIFTGKWSHRLQCDNYKLILQFSVRLMGGKEAFPITFDLSIYFDTGVPGNGAALRSTIRVKDPRWVMRLGEREMGDECDKDVNGKERLEIRPYAY